MDALRAGVPVPPARPPGDRFPVRYRPVRALKRGNGVETWLVTDTVSGSLAVLKSIDPDCVHAAARLRFQHEADVLRELAGTGLPGLIDAGRTHDGLYLVQPHLPGRTLEQRLGDGPLPLTDALWVVSEIAAALEIAHGAGVVHRDVKPANVVLGDDGAVSLIDFGFARSPRLDSSIRDELVGTVRYLAPEAAGLLEAPVDERSDLYAVGVLLFEAVSGRAPFTGPTVGDVLRQHLSAPVPALREAGAAAPRALDQILARLLRKDPAERYQSAGALAGDLLALRRALLAGDREPRLVLGRLDQRRSLTDPAFVGRETELDTFTTLVGRLRDGEGGLLSLDAESGGGKSRLLQEVASAAARDDVVVLRGQGVAQSGSTPFTLLHGVAEGLALRLAADPVLRARVRAGLGDAAPAVARALPSLAGPLEVALDGDRGPEQFGEQRNLDALLRLLGAVGSPDAPVLLVLDDCQWADRLTVRLLQSLAGAVPAGLAVVVAFRSEEVSPGSSLRRLRGAQSMHLGPLTSDAVRALSESMAGPLPGEVVATVVRLADGSPFMAAAVLRGLVESGALTGSADGWRVDAEALADVQAARRSAAVLVRRLELLPAEARKLLSVGAVLGKSFDVDTAVRLAGSPVGAAAALEQARLRRLLWVDERTGRCSFSHDKIREALLARLDPGDRRQLHAAAADELATYDDDVFALAYHLDAAGRHAEALPHALRGAELARGRHALDTAVVHYRMAERGVDEDDIDTRRRLAVGLGEVLTLQGAYDQAGQHLAAARELVRDRHDAATLSGKLGDVAFKRGDITTARGHVEGALNLLGRRTPATTVVLLGWLLWELAVQVVHSLLPRLSTGRRAAAGADDVLAMQLYSRLAYVHWFGSGRVPCAWAHLRGMNLAERHPPSAELGQAWSEHAPVMTMLPWYGRGERYARRSLEVRTALDDGWGQGQSLGFLGVVLYAASRYEESMQACHEAIRLLEKTGDRWECNTAGWHVAMCLSRTGRLVEAAQAAEEVLLAAQAIGDSASTGIALSVLARAREGRVDEQLVDGELARGTDDAHTLSELRLAAALRARRDGDLGRAEEHLRAALRSTRNRGLRQEYVAPVPAWCTTVLREQAEAWPPHDSRGRRAVLRRAAKASRRARWWALAYRNNAPHALREHGLITSLRGSRRRALRALNRSLAVAESQGAAHEAALTRLALAAVGMPADSDRLERARGDVVALQVPEVEDGRVDDHATVSLFDRFTTLLTVGRQITAATSFSGLHQAVRDAGLTLLRGERCHLVSATAVADAGPGGAGLTTESGESVDAISRTVVERAVRAGVPVVAGDSGADDSESLLLSGMRSVLAAPVFVRGEPVSCFYVTHRQVGQLFGDEEVQLAEFISTLAGASLEHLAGSESRFRSLAQNSSDVLTLVDQDGVVGYQSPAVTRVFGQSAQALVGRSVVEWLHPGDVHGFTAALHKAMQTGEARVECRVQHADGSFRHVETAVRDLRADPMVRSVVLNSRDITDRRRLEDELRERALHDALTGLPNRVLFLDRARHALSRARRRPTPFCVAFLDLDDFKSVNDTFGHAAGDELLQAVAARLVACVRPADTVARLGGDEFAVLLEASDLTAAAEVASRMLQATALPVALAGTEVVVHTSIGLTLADDATQTPDQLLAQADAAMYAAKERGKQRFDVFVPAMQVAMQARSRMRTELEWALTRGEFRLCYQPVVDLRTGRKTGVEALVRWQHPERGLLNPDDFIAHAEDSGQILGIGAWVLETACRDACLLPASIRMSVNVSARQLQHPDLVRDVRAALASSGLPAQRLTLEITETATVSGSEAEVEATIARLTELRTLGLQIALDDFGTGYSPLSYLRRYPVDMLKVDQSFVTGIVGGAEDEAIVRGVVEMAHALGMCALAEGIETPEQAALLAGLGCDLGQGYLWMRPAPLDDVRRWLDA